MAVDMVGVGEGTGDAGAGGWCWRRDGCCWGGRLMLEKGSDQVHLFF